MKLNAATLEHLPAAIERPGYARDGLVPGVVHIGPGAFHRAHQAAFLDTVLTHDPRWAVSAVALNSTGVANALGPQDGLYTLALLDRETRLRVIGSIVEWPTAGEAQAIEHRLAAPTTRLITATVTEKGYCLTADGTLDHDHPGIRRDLASPDRPSTLVGWLVHGLAGRRRDGAGGLTILSCDNLAANGERLRRGVLDFAAARGGDLARWIEGEVRFPSSMVDAITPATDAGLRERIAEMGVEDAWPIQREAFAQWVIEDDFAGERPPLHLAGAQFVGSVTGWEETKLRLLNGAHSSLAYLGLLLGHASVAEAMADPALAGFVERLMRRHIAPTLAGEGIDLPGYIDAVLARFRNPAIRHLLSQIAWDGSQKLPFRLLGTIADARAAGRPVEALAVPVAAWLRFLGQARATDDPLVDPLAARLLPPAQTGDIDALIALPVFPAVLQGDAAFRAALAHAYRAMADAAGVRATLADG